MKRIFPFLLLFLSLAFVACEKQELPAPNTNNTTVPVSVEYRITAVSGHMNIQYQAPDANGNMETKINTIDRTNFSFKFDMTPGKSLKVSASNAIPSGDEVHAAIYVNGQLFREGFANAPGTTAVAEGQY